MSKINGNFKERQTVLILESVYRNAKLAYRAAGAVMKRCPSGELYSELAREQSRYKQVSSRARAELSKRGAAAYEASAAVRSAVKTGIAIRTAMKNTTGELAEIMFKGTTMGIIDMQRTLNHSRAAHGSVILSAERLLEREQQFCDRLKRYL